MFHIPHLEMHVAHACNLTCESCSHFSGTGHKGVVDYGTATGWMSAWSRRISPGIFKVLGGEPTMAPALTDILLDIPNFFPNTKVHFSTNGFFVHRHMRLGWVLGQLKSHVTLSLHSHETKYMERLKSNIEMMKQWASEYGFTLAIGDGVAGWTRRYHGTGGEIKPFNDENPRKSWETCTAKHYPQLCDYKLWKCAPHAYINLVPFKFPHSIYWKLMRETQPLSNDCSDAELIEWIQREDEPMCALCPTKLEQFQKPNPMRL